jgi:ubiquinol-cytochrome c reductase cytochrome c1 subunit
MIGLAAGRLVAGRLVAGGMVVGGMLALVTLAGAARAQETTEPPHIQWSFEGPFGTFDRASEQRGYQVYKEICSNCHSLKEGFYRNLTGIGLSPEQVTATAASVNVPTIADDGTEAERPALSSDHFRSPFANEKAARAANNGALPPDLSLIEKARAGGADYVHGILTGFSDPPTGMKMGDGLYYNKYFPGHQIAMPPPLHDGQVTYADGTPATVDQMARDVTTFLTYISEPETEERKRMGVRIVIFLALMAGVTYAVKRKVWSDVH